MYNYFRYGIVVLLSFFVWSKISYAQIQDTSLVIKPVPKDPLKKLGKLFKSDELVKISITTDMKSLLKDRGNQSSKHTAMMATVDEKNGQQKIPIVLQTRGNFRRAKSNCEFPPLWLYFDGKAKDKTVFKKQDKVKLVTHCVKDDYVQREYYVYKIFNLITEFSFLVRSCEVTYIDSLDESSPKIHSAFIIEPEEDFAIRKGLNEIENVKISQSSIDTMNMATIAVFEYMIGNTDWSVPAQHNIKLYHKDKKKVFAVPYDFDHSGLVGTNYATPHPILGIGSVEDRLYRSIHFPAEVFNKVFQKFEKVKPEIYKIYLSENTLEERYKKFVIQYLDEFYKKIADRAATLREFNESAMHSLQK